MPVDDLILKSVDPLIKDLKLENKKVGQVMVGCCTTHIDAHGLARDVVARTQLNQDSPAFLVRGGCVSSLEAVSVIANKIALGQIESGIACGGESISDVPLEFNKNFQQFALKFFYLRERRNGLLLNLVTK
jgi:acetyl-CoA C-acetyltransferase